MNNVSIIISEAHCSLRSELYSLFCSDEILLEKAVISYSSNFNAILIPQAYLTLFDNGRGNLERNFSSARVFEINVVSLHKLFFIDFFLVVIIIYICYFSYF